MRFAPQAFRESRIDATKMVEQSFKDTDFLNDITAINLKANPSMLPVLRMSTCPPVAVDRLVGLAGVPKGIVDAIEKKKKLAPGTTDTHLDHIIGIIDRLLDRDIFPWLSAKIVPNPVDAHRAAIIVADRYCGALTNPIIRNAQEERQLKYVENWLVAQGHTKLSHVKGATMHNMPPGTFSFRMVVPVQQVGSIKNISIPVDAVIKPLNARPDDFPLLVEAKSAGDFTNTNKRRKEEAVKMIQLKHTYGPNIRFVLFLCGYFDAPYLGYSAAEGIDWVWEHRIDDLTKMGL